MLLAPAHYHGNFIGALDEKRSELVLCAPIFHCEFSGNESIDEFHEMNVKRVHTDIWTRNPEPKIFVRFNNDKTGGGTKGNKYVLMSYARLIDEIHNLKGVINGFIDVRNYMDEIVSITSNSPDAYQLKSNKEKVEVNAAILSNKINDFLTR